MASLGYRPSEKRQGFWLALPAVTWLGLFFLFPLLIILVVSFMTPRAGGAQLPFTFKSYLDIFGEIRWNGQPDTPPLIFYGVILAALIGFGAAWYLAPKNAQRRQTRIIAAVVALIIIAAVLIVGQPEFRASPYFGVLVDSVWIAFLTTAICVVLGYPLAFYIATRQSKFVRQFTLFLVILPFWTNFLVRTYAWIGILGNTENGTINGVLMHLGIIQQPLTLLFTQNAVLVGLVYGFLPFMVLPIYASVERFDFHFVEAAHDLGANDWWAFWRVVFPITLPGVVAGCILVFIPAIGAFVTPDLMGGTQGLMIGNLITSQFRGAAGNWPRGAAFSMVMMALVLVSLIVYVRFGDQE